VWSLFHVAVMVLGLLLLIKARQPVWLEVGARQVWGQVRGWAGRYRIGAPLALGAAWALMPCGLLYSAVLLAALSGGAIDGALTMAAFAVGSSVSLLVGPWLLLHIRGAGAGDWGVRLAGLLLFISSAWALWMALANDAAPWCVTP
jgi:sulfite exporter TauE/SafE